MLYTREVRVPRVLLNRKMTGGDFGVSNLQLNHLKCQIRPHHFPFWYFRYHEFESWLCRPKITDMNAPTTSGVVSVSRDVSRFIFGHYQKSIWIIISRKSLIMIFQPRNPVAFLPGSDAYMDNWCDIKCRKGINLN